MNRLNQQGVGAIVLVLILLLMGAVGFAGWKVWSSTSNSTNSGQNSTKPDSDTDSQVNEQTESEATTGVVITTDDSEFGKMLFNDKQQAIYIWELEESNKAECYGNCAEAWPPVLTDGMPIAAGDVKQELLGTTQRSDGSTQVTYNSHPLYYYAHEGPGEVKCHNIKTHGGLWWVIQPNGIRAD